MSLITPFDAALYALTPTVWYKLNGDAASPSDGTAAADEMGVLAGEYKGAGTKGLAAARSGHAGVGQLRQFRRSGHSYMRTADAGVLDLATSADTAKWSIHAVIVWNPGSVDGTTSTSYMIIGRSFNTSYAEPYHSFGFGAAAQSTGLPIRVWSEHGGNIVHNDPNPASFKFTADTLAHVVITYDATLSSNQLKVYKDGALAAQLNTTDNAPRDASGRFLINCLHDAGVISAPGSFDIAHVAVWAGTALTSGNVSTLYGLRDDLYVSNVSPPTIAGDTPTGSVLTVTPGTWIGTPTPSLTYQWLRDGVPIAGQTGLTYTTGPLDGEKDISCEETATNTHGNGAVESDPITMDANLGGGQNDAATNIGHGRYYG